MACRLIAELHTAALDTSVSDLLDSNRKSRLQMTRLNIWN
jgi:hypothetical protein